jgi:hypothetical protein
MQHSEVDPEDELILILERHRALPLPRAGGRLGGPERWCVGQGNVAQAGRELLLAPRQLRPHRGAGAGRLPGPGARHVYRQACRLQEVCHQGATHDLDRFRADRALAGGGEGGDGGGGLEVVALASRRGLSSWSHVVQ